MINLKKIKNQFVYSQHIGDVALTNIIKKQVIMHDLGQCPKRPLRFLNLKMFLACYYSFSASRSYIKSSNRKQAVSVYIPL